MKKVLLSAVAILTFSFANAQEEATTSTGSFAKGDMFLSGSFGIGSDKSYDMDSGDLVTTDGFNISPKFGFFVSDNIAVGAKLGYGSSKVEIDGVSGETKVNEFSAGAFGRYYLTPANQFSLFGELAVDYMSTDYDTFDVKRDGINAGLGLGMNYFVSSRFSIEAGVGLLNYSSMKFDFSGAENENSFNFGANLANINLGLVYKL